MNELNVIMCVCVVSVSDTEQTFYQKCQCYKGCCFDMYLYLKLFQWPKINECFGCVNVSILVELLSPDEWINFGDVDGLRYLISLREMAWLLYFMYYI